MAIDAIVPCYNEAPRAGKVLKVLTSSKHIAKVIFVDDGSTDNSAEVARHFPKVQVIQLKKNRGKGQAVREGLKHVTSAAVFLCDADLSGLSEQTISKLVKAHQDYPRSLVVGLKEKYSSPGLRWLRENLFPLIAGERILLTETLKEILAHRLSSEYGIEPYMNYYFRKHNRPIIKILMTGVNDTPKYHKENHGWRPHLAEGLNILHKYLNIYAREVPKSVFEGFKSFVFPTVTTPGQDYPHSQITINNVKLNYVQIGQGPALVFIHGLANNWEGWIPIIPYLREKFTLYFLDLPGFGDSDSLQEYSVQTAAWYVAQFIRTLPQKSAQAIIGASMGTIVTGELVRREPNLVESIILIGPVIKDNNRKVLASTLKYSLFVIRHFNLSETALKKILETRVAAYTIAKTINMYKFDRFIVDTYNLIGKKKMRKEAFTQMAISSAEYELKAVIKKFQLPTLLLYGREDKISSPAYARKILQPTNPNLTIVEIPEAGHVVPMEKPQQTAKAIEEFLEKLKLNHKRNGGPEET